MFASVSCNAMPIDNVVVQVIAAESQKIEKKEKKEKEKQQEQQQHR